MDTVIISAPSSKSLTHRALMAAGLAQGESKLEGLLESDDTKLTRELMTALGAQYTPAGPGAFHVTGMGRRLPAGGGEDAPLSLFVGESGTSCRLITAIAAAGQGCFRVHGAGRMHERPIGELAAALRHMGAGFRFEEKENCPPFIMKACRAGVVRDGEGTAFLADEVSIGCEESSQYLSGLLMAAPLRAGLSVALTGKKAVSWPYVGLTLDVMSRFGARFAVQALDGEKTRDLDWRMLKRAEPGKLCFVVEGGGYKAHDYRVEGDWSGASYFLAAGAIGPKPVRVAGLNVDSLQGDALIIDILRKMGARTALSDNGVTVFPSELHGVELDMGDCPDLVPTVAALAAHAKGNTVIRNVAHLAVKESDRIAAPAAELAKAGCRVIPSIDGLVVSPPESGLRAPGPDLVFSSHNDHRIAMSLCLLGLPGKQGQGFAVRLDNPDCVAKSFPSFWLLWEKVAA